METNPTNRRLLGLLFIIVGAVLLMRFMGYIPFNLPYYFFSWKTILMALGIVFILSEKSKSTGVILFTIGAVFLARDIFRVDFATLIQLALPIMLLVIGLVILLPRRHHKKFRYHGITVQEVKGTMSEVNIFSGGTKYVNSDNFNGGEITCIFGGSDLNFKNATLAPGNNVLDVSCIFGGCTLYVPEDWTVHIETTNVFAGFTDNRFKTNLNMATDPNKVLFIKGALIFGGGEIKVA
ncbi:MAG: LiaF-related protein [Bacteroidales bacterium]